MIESEVMRRREVLRRIALLTGGAVAAPAVLACLQACAPKEGAPAAAAAWTPKFFKGTQAEVVTAIADAILPKTDTAGALDANVPAFIDAMLADVYAADAQARFNQGFEEFGGKAFLERDQAGRSAYVKESLEKALAAEHAGKPFILTTRELTLLGFYTSKVGISENMEYVAVPTAFHGCVPISSLPKPVYWE